MDRKELENKLEEAASISDLAMIAAAMEETSPGHKEEKKLFMEKARPILGRASVGEAISLANAFGTWTGHNAILQFFAQENGLKNIKEAAWIITAVKDSSTGSFEVVKAIFEAARMFLAGASLAELLIFADKIEDPSRNGTDSLPMEEAVINAAMPKIKNIDDATSLAEAFSVKTGRNRFIRTYAEDNGFTNENEARKLLGLIKGKAFGGEETREVIFSIAKKAGIEIDPATINDDNCTCPACQLRRGLLDGMEKGGLDPGLRGLFGLLSGLNRLESMLTPGTVALTADQLEQALAAAQKSGKLGKVVFNGPGGEILPIKEYLLNDSCRKSLSPEMITVIEKYVAILA